MNRTEAPRVCPAVRHLGVVIALVLGLAACAPTAIPTDQRQVDPILALAERGKLGTSSPGIRTPAAIFRASSAFVFVPYLVVIVRPGPELPLPDDVRWVGLGLAVAGVAFALWAMRTLGRHFDVELEVHEGHEVIDRGPYMLGASFPAFYRRAAAEERLLSGRLGPAYAAYARRVPMLIPFLRPRSSLPPPR